MNPPFFPEVIDASLLSSFKSCNQQAKKVYFDHWKPKDGVNVHLTAGGAFASGLEAARRSFFEQGLDVESSISKGLQALVTHYGDFQCPADSPKSLERTAGALEFYFQAYPLSHSAGYPILLPDKQRAIEVNFAHPLPILHPVTGNPLLYVGRSDMICNYAGAVYVEDDKTTSRLGPTWVDQWDLRSQFLGYMWGVREMGVRAQGMLVRGVSILKTKYETLEALPGYTDFEIDRWYQELLLWLEDMINCWRTGVWKYNFDHACNDYGGCGFRKICKMQNELPWLEMAFEKRHWDPVHRTETKL